MKTPTVEELIETYRCYTKLLVDSINVIATGWDEWTVKNAEGDVMRHRESMLELETQLNTAEPNWPTRLKEYERRDANWSMTCRIK